jgi:hypothetical protein
MTDEEETRFRELPKIIAHEKSPDNVVMWAAELELLLTIKLEEPKSDRDIKSLHKKVARADTSESEAMFSALKVALEEHTRYVGGINHDGPRRKASSGTYRIDRKGKEP